MRSSALSVLFFTLFALLFSVAYAAPIASPNVSSERACTLARCDDAVSTQPDDSALHQFLDDVRSVVKRFKASLAQPPYEPPTPTPSTSPSSSGYSTAPSTSAPQPSPTHFRWFTEIAIPASDDSGSEA